MDNVTHTLVGAAMGEAGLKKRTGLGMAALMISANIPDVDALAMIFGDPLAFRRGWTHGPIGLVVLPAFLTLVLMGWERLQKLRSRRPDLRPPVLPVQLLLLSYAGALSHPFLDWLNDYGIRLLMPFSHEWFYGDAVFIIDPLLWLALGTGIYLSRRRERLDRHHPVGPARALLLVVTAYIGLMVSGSQIAHTVAERKIEAREMGPVENLMAGPVPLNPLRRQLIYDTGDSYGFGSLQFSPLPVVTLEPGNLPKNDEHPAAIEARGRQTVQSFLYWSRFPFYEVERSTQGYHVYIGDLRFSRDARAGWASRRVFVEVD